MILFLCNGTNEMIQPKDYSPFGLVSTKWKHINPVYRRLDRELCKHSIVPPKMYLGKWFKNLEDYDTIIIEALTHNQPLIDRILSIDKNRDKRIILWHWNKVFEFAIQPDNPKYIDCELWSFDEDDCKQYRMKKNTQYFDPSWTEQIHYKPVRDVWFVGTDKCRLEKLLRVKNSFEVMGLKCKFIIVADDHSNQNSYKFDKPMKYSETLVELAKSKAVLDIPLSGQKGLTLRPLEAMFFKRKLITENVNIINYSFYRKENVFILGKDNISDLGEWINTPFNNSIESDLSFYSVKEWLKRFIK